MDLDGTLVDFDGGVLKLLGKAVLQEDNKGRTEMWQAIKKSRAFWSDLEWLSDGRELWEGIQERKENHSTSSSSAADGKVGKRREKNSASISSAFTSSFSLSILTGVPVMKGFEQPATAQKIKWCKNNLGAHITVICCAPKINKKLHSAKNCILIDDDKSMKREWEAGGGVFILRTTAAETLQNLDRVLLQLKEGIEGNPDGEAQVEEEEEKTVNNGDNVWFQGRPHVTQHEETPSSSSDATLSTANQFAGRKEKKSVREEGEEEVTCSLKIIQQLKNKNKERNDVSLSSIAQKYKLILRQHPFLPLVQISYSQIESSMSSPLVQECRGLIVEKDTWKVIALPFTKFFNSGEKLAHTFEWGEGVSVYEKLDGSLMTLYYYQGWWHVASNKLPAADGKLPSGRQCESLAQYFWTVWDEQKFHLPKNVNCCYMFELLLAEQPIIVRHEKNRLVCLGARNLRTFQEIPCDVLAKQEPSWTFPRTFPEISTSLLHAELFARTLDPVKFEGFVAVDKNFSRLKIKSPAYVALHHLVDNQNKELRTEEHAFLLQRRLLEIVRANEGSEFLAYYPKLATNFHAVRKRFSLLVELVVDACVGGGKAIPQVSESETDESDEDNENDNTRKKKKSNKLIQKTKRKQKQLKNKNTQANEIFLMVKNSVFDLMRKKTKETATPISSSSKGNNSKKRTNNTNEEESFTTKGKNRYGSREHHDNITSCAKCALADMDLRVLETLISLIPPVPVEEEQKEAVHAESGEEDGTTQTDEEEETVKKSNKTDKVEDEASEEEEEDGEETETSEESDDGKASTTEEEAEADEKEGDETEGEGEGDEADEKDEEGDEDETEGDEDETEGDVEHEKDKDEGDGEENAAEKQEAHESSNGRSNATLTEKRLGKESNSEKNLDVNRLHERAALKDRKEVEKKETKWKKAVDKSKLVEQVETNRQIIVEMMMRQSASGKNGKNKGFIAESNPFSLIQSESEDDSESKETKEVSKKNIKTNMITSTQLKKNKMKKNDSESGESEDEGWSKPGKKKTLSFEQRQKRQTITTITTTTTTTVVVEQRKQERLEFRQNVGKKKKKASLTENFASLSLIQSLNSPSELSQGVSAEARAFFESFKTSSSASSSPLLSSPSLTLVETKTIQSTTVTNISTLKSPSTTSNFLSQLCSFPCSGSLALYPPSSSSGPGIILLIGLPGSGKSTFREALLARCPGVRVRVISQDELKTKQKCLEVARSSLMNNYSIIVDRVNFDVSQRAQWLQMLPRECDKKIAIIFATSVEECIDRVMQRKGHPTLKPSPKTPGIVRSFEKTFVVPLPSEKICQVISMIPSQLEVTVENVGALLTSWHKN